MDPLCDRKRRLSPSAPMAAHSAGEVDASDGKGFVQIELFSHRRLPLGAEGAIITREQATKNRINKTGALIVKDTQNVQ
jgi:hypothetical protein